MTTKPQRELDAEKISDGLYTRELSGDRPYFIFDITKARYEAGGRALVM